MKATRTTKIRIEKRESRFIRFARETSSYCSGCLRDTRHLPVAQMATLLDITEKAVFRLADSEQIRSAETADGHLLICTECTCREADLSSEVFFIAEVSK